MKKITKLFEKLVFLPARKINSLEEKKKRIEFLVYFFDVFFWIIIFTIYMYSREIISEYQVSNSVVLTLSFIMVALTLVLIYKHIMYMNEIRELVEKYIKKIKIIEREEL